MSGKYLAARDAFGSGQLSWPEDRLLAQLVSAACPFDERAADAATLKGKIGKPVAVPARTVREGWAGFAKIVFPQVGGSEQPAAVVFHRDDGLLVFHSSDIIGFPMVPNGGDIEIESPAPGLFRL